MKKLRIILSLLLMFPFMLYAQETEKEEIVVVKVKSNGITRDTCIHIEKITLKNDNTLVSDSLLKAGNSEIIFIDKEGKKSSIHPDSLNTIPVNLIEKIMIQDKGKSKVVVIEEKSNPEDCTIQKDKPAKDKQKIKYADVKLDIYSGEEEISEEEIKKIAEKIKNLFNPAEIEIKESKDENEQQVIHIRIVKNKKE